IGRSGSVMFQSRKAGKQKSRWKRLLRGLNDNCKINQAQKTATVGYATVARKLLWLICAGSYHSYAVLIPRIINVHRTTLQLPWQNWRDYPQTNRRQWYPRLQNARRESRW